MSEVVVYRRRTVVSLVMMLFALALGAGGYLLTSLNQNGTFPADWLMSAGPLQFGGPWYLGLAAWFALGLACWGVTAWRLPYADPLILPTAFLLAGLGISMIYRLDQADGKRSAELQMLWLFLAVAAFIALVVWLRDHRRLQRYTYLWFLAGFLLLLAPLVPGLGKENHGARIWIEVGPFSFQPAEIARIVLSIAFAAYLVEKKDVLALAGRFQGHHTEHAEALAATVEKLGGRPVAAKARYDFPVDSLRNQADVLRFAAGLEKGAVSAYLGAVPLFGDRELAKVAASILGDEAMHWAVLRHAVGEEPVPVAFVS